MSSLWCTERLSLPRRAPWALAKATAVKMKALSLIALLLLMDDGGAADLLVVVGLLSSALYAVYPRTLLLAAGR